MIIVTVDVPIMGSSYDFQIDEDIPLHVIRNELTEMICRRNQCALSGKADEIMLWDVRRQVLLNPRSTAYENGLVTGSRLMLA